ncbi:aminodeoxychorismate synthase component I [Streptacidiphilus fuscans]|uniref:Aminodeoxychorismate synthase n=1 Tax=Streptacidiphilus fuscans TaxID=2789292 RepID=A0A931B850_9ACTN|nr:aminodeoxychorismate synthase component I [Streptacidiphilus fuscans]MBF9070786.1 aminodeoxychorismate synthase component I [Streptacidiphilus fuscans]
MRTLLIDNYDSFTYNLFHQLTEVTGHEPEVVRNDAPTWRTEHLEEYDSVVISPGPGTPGRAADFGICREILERADLPVLGICLGFQGIGLAHGATVGLAPEPRHGRTSPVLHDGEGLFAGLPSPFEAVRYHSLAVSDLPDVLEATAWTPDGVLMGLRHRERPMWGVQFHPESICTQYGHDLLANFAELTARWRASRTRGRRRPVAAAAADVATAATAAVAPAPVRRRLRVLTRQLPTRWDAEVAYDRLFRGGKNSYWLDSSRPDPVQGRFSVMGDASGPLARTVRADVWSGTVTVESVDATEVVAADLLDWLDQDLRRIRTDLPALPFDFALGWVGYLGYELKAQCGGELRHRSSEPDAVLVFADRALVVDHFAGTTHLLALAEDDEKEQATAWLDDATAALAGLTGVLRSEPGAVAATPSADIGLRHPREQYLRLIDRCHEEITAGESYEVCLTNMAEAEHDLDPWQGYRRLRRAHPVPFAALLQFEELSVLSTSPERFLQVSADGVAESRPIKGTRPRGATPEQDAALAAELGHDEKDRSENLMVVDLVRHDLGRCAVPGTVEAKQLFDVESYATVHQLVSTVRAQLREGLSAVDCVRAAFPGGSMTGAPKLRTMQIIDDLESGPRGVYSGAIGYLSLSGAADLSIAIRTAVVARGQVRYGIGGAIVALSDPAAEFEETRVKAAPLLTLTGACFPGLVRPVTTP